MKNDPVVSVVLCFYNEERFIEEAIASVIHQTMTEWELLLVDDGSSDRSTYIARQFSQRYPDKILYLWHPGHCNEGLSASRTLGIARARGKFIAFLDADDTWSEVKLADQLEIFATHPVVSVLLESSRYWKSWCGKEVDTIVDVGVSEGIYHPPQLMLKLYPLSTGSAPCPSGIMVRRDVLERCNFEESFRGIYQMYEDQAFLCKVYLNEVVYVSHRCHNNYRQRPSSLVSSVYESGKYHIVRKYYLQWFVTYLKWKHVSHKQVWKLTKAANLPYQRPWLHRMTTEWPKFGKAILARILVRLGLLHYHKA